MNVRAVLFMNLFLEVLLEERFHFLRSKRFADHIVLQTKGSKRLQLDLMLRFNRFVIFSIIIESHFDLLLEQLGHFLYFGVSESLCLAL